MSDDRDAAFMRRALELAGRARGFTHPNPLVGAVIVRDGLVVGEGWHREYGRPHAEVEALRAAGDAARGATMYVSLEPCAHQGRTPPCTDAVLHAGITRLVYAAADPNPAAGGGARRLHAAGVEVVEGIEREAARDLNAAFFAVHERGAPFIALKLALSLDGRIAGAPGERTQLTGREAQIETHLLRADHEAVLVGGRTADIDDPLLTVRLVPCRRPPVRIVATSDATIADDARLLTTLDQAPLWILCADDAPAARVRALHDAGATVLAVPRGADARLDLTAARACLAAEGIRSVLVEGGAAMAASLLNGRLVDRLHLFMAPRLIGTPGVRGLDPDGASQWRLAEVRRLGEDVLMTLAPATTQGARHDMPTAYRDGA